MVSSLCWGNLLALQLLPPSRVRGTVIMLHSLRWEVKPCSESPVKLPLLAMNWHYEGFWQSVFKDWHLSCFRQALAAATSFENKDAPVAASWTMDTDVTC